MYICMKHEEEIEYFIKWLRNFYLQSPKKKTKIIKKLSKSKDKDERFMSDWLESVRDFDIDQQFELANELRCSGW